MTAVLLVGAGQLGSRYLQGLKSVPEPLHVTVVDPSAEALALAERRWDQVGLARQHPRPTFRGSVRKAIAPRPAFWDLAIVSTGAQHRLDVVTEIVARTAVRHWVLEKVLAQSSTDVRALEQQVGNLSAAFVNTSRRMMSGYAAIRKLVVPPLSVEIVGAKWGLASNAIHFIDMVAWMTRSGVSHVSVISEYGGWYETKRAGTFDMTGRVDAAFADGSELSMVSVPQGGTLSVSIVDSAGAHWTINQAAGIAWTSAGEMLQVDFELQSAMTPHLVTELLTTGSCDLPTLEDSARIHEPLLDALLGDWNAVTGRSDSRVPIT